jgi:hypothetical protein
VPKALFDTVREEMLGPVMPKVCSPQDAPFTHLLYNETGETMLPTYDGRHSCTNGYELNEWAMPHRHQPLLVCSTNSSSAHNLSETPVAMAGLNH